MRITRLSLERFRVYEDRLDLEVPAGLVGIYGANGAGKSVLLDAIRFALYGKSRTGNDEIRTSGTNGDCVAEVEFEHEGHLYLVRRTLTGSSTTVKAEAHWNGQQVAEGVRDVTAYVHSVLGMDDAAFRASVFAEQKQVAAFSGQSPQKRRELVLRLLGITPLDKARDSARADAREARADHERLSARLPDLEELDEQLVAATTAAEEVAGRVAAAVAGFDATAAAVEAAEQEAERLDDVRRTYDDLVTRGKAAKAVVTDADARLEALAEEAAALEVADERLAELRPLAEGVDDLEARIRLLDAAESAQAALADLPDPGERPEEPDEAAVDLARVAAEAASAAASSIEGEIKSLEAELVRARDVAERSTGLSPDEDCPVCGQALGDALEQVQAHRNAEVVAAEERLATAKKELTAARRGAEQATAALATATKELKAAQQALARWEQVASRRTDAEASLTRALALLDPAPVDGSDGARTELDAARTDLQRRRAAATEASKLEGMLERRPRLVREVEQAEARRQAEAAQEREALLEKVKALAYDADAHEAQKQARAAAREAHKRSAAAVEAVKVEAARALGQVETAKERLDDGRARHAEIADLAERSRHLGRLADLLNDFRNNVVATVGPRLAAQAAELFAELTDREYDALEVDPDTYELQIRDGGRVYGMDRFSGSETDLANLALRVAISEQVRFQSGGAVGLLVLDEVFGPLDDDRKERMLLALERLRGRFRQVLVVTHDTGIKEQLPSAIQVVKQAGRRATAEVLAGI